ncbi:hypothetical protein Ndes2526B_g09344 [Nannochloris sp. 'desiccata']|nr:hypothetical protein KSW81_003627 [Chlorella desiccata (nom. nud.)]
MGACLSSRAVDDPANHSSKSLKNNKNGFANSSKGGIAGPGTPGGAAPALAKGTSSTTDAAAAPEVSKAVKQRQMRKRIAVAAETITFASDVEVLNITKTEAAHQLISKAMIDNVLFQDLSLAARQAIINSMTAQVAKPGDVIITQGEADASKYYVVDRGAFEVYTKDDVSGEDKMVHTCMPGSGFGELALLYSAPRAATVKAAETGRLWVMERAVYAAIKRTETQELRKQKRELLERVPMLAVLAPEHKNAVSEALALVEFSDGDAVCTQGELGERFFTIKEGTVTVSKDGKQVAKLSDGAYFGERALIRDEPRAASIIAEGYVVCFALSRTAFNDLLGPIEDVWRYETLRKVPILSNLSERQLFELARRVKSVQFSAGDVLFRQGDPGDSFYVVEDGCFTVLNAEGLELARCGKGQCFGELALLKSEPRAATVTALGPSKALACTKDVFDAHLGSLEEIRNVWRFEALSKVPLLTGLSQKQRLALCSAFEAKEFAAGENVVSKGDPGDAFFVIEKGTCSVFADENKELNRLGPASYFGERALLRNEPRAATVRATTNATLLRLARNNFENLLGPLQDVLRQQTAAYDAAITAEKITGTLKLSDLQHVAILGAGAFGRVSLVKYQGRCYALKALAKGHVVQSGLSAHIKREKALQVEFASPFLVSLLSAFQDETMLYMLMEVVQGGEFFAYLQGRERALKEDDARFYAGCVVLGLEYMHDRGVAWRDLKPENLLLDSAGYLKITDFGFAKRIPPGTRSYTLCGTPEYLAPELVTQSGHGRAVDWWAVGVLIYEMVAGFPPFSQEDRVAMFRAICNSQYRLPEHFSPTLRDLIKQFLVRVPNRRLGCMQGGVAEVKQHPWFAGFDWDALAQRKMAAPFVPKVSSPEDASNFDGANVAPPKDAGRYQSTGVFKDF